MKRAALLAGIALSLAAPLDVHAHDVDFSPQRDAIVALIHQAADAEGISPTRLVALLNCESELDPWAVSPDGRYHGLGQFSAATWRYLAPLAGWAGTSPYNPEAAAAVVAYSVARGGGPRRWPACYRQAWGR